MSREVAGFSLSLRTPDPHVVVERHTHEDAHFIVLLDGHYISSARDAGHIVGGPSLIVPADFIARATTVQRHASGEAEYGYLFWNRAYRSTCGSSSGWYMSGNGGNAVVLLRDLHAVLVVTRVHYNSRGMHDETRKLIESFALPNLPCPGAAAASPVVRSAMRD